MIKKIFKLMEEVSIYWTAAFLPIKGIKLRAFYTFYKNNYESYDIIIPFLPYKNSLINFTLIPKKEITFKLSNAGILKVKFLQISLSKEELTKIWKKHLDSLNKELDKLNDNKRKNKICKNP